MSPRSKRRSVNGAPFEESFRLGLAYPTFGEAYHVFKNAAVDGLRFKTSVFIEICRSAGTHAEQLPWLNGFLVRRGCTIDWRGDARDAVDCLIQHGYGPGKTVEGFRISAWTGEEGGLVFEKPWGHPSGQVAEKSWFEFTKEEAAEVHKHYMRLSRERAREGFRLSSYLERDLTNEEKNQVKCYWLWMKALAEGTIPPITKEQVHFVRAATTWDTDWERPFERLWAICSGDVEVGC